MQFLTCLLAAAAPSAVAGTYQAQQMEVGAALELEKNGHFRYQLDYGAVSEHAEGDWTFDGNTFASQPDRRRSSRASSWFGTIPHRSANW